MTINSEHKVVVAVGESVSYDGKVWRCVLDFGTSPDNCYKHCSFYNRSMMPICKMMECRYSFRPDGNAVHFVLLGAQEGGEDESK